MLHSCISELAFAYMHSLTHSLSDSLTQEIDIIILKECCYIEKEEEEEMSTCLGSTLLFYSPLSLQHAPAPPFRVTGLFLFVVERPFFSFPFKINDVTIFTTHSRHWTEKEM